MISILIADDSPAVRQGLRMRVSLEPDLAVVGEAGTGLEAVELAQSCSPDVVVMDVEMPVMDGIAATRLLRTVAPASHVIVHSIHRDAATVAAAQRAGAASFVEKQGAVDVLLAAIRAAAFPVNGDRGGGG